MEYRFRKDPLFGKYCYIDTPWIAGKRTIYRIVNSGVRSNAWVEVPISGREEVVLHDYQDDVIFVVLDTLISEDSRIKKVALKDVKIADIPQTENVVGDKATLTIKDGVVKVAPQTDCITCRYNSDEWDSPKCDSCSKAHSNYEPQTDCGWK